MIERFKDARLNLYTIEELKEIAEKITGKPDKIDFTDRIIGSTYRDGSVIDVLREVKDI